MASTIQVEIVSAEQAIYSGEATLVSASAQMGEVGVTPGHTPFITRIKPGEVRVKPAGDGEELDIYVSGGILEVQPYAVTILADTVMRAGDIDEAAAQKAKEEAERLLADATPGDGEVDFSAVQMQLAEAAAQLQLAKKLKRN